VDRNAGKVLDELLVLAARGGASAAFGELVLRWSPGLRRHARRLLGDPDRVDDVVQDTWVSVARGLRRLDDPARFPGWIFAIATRRCVDVLRRAVRDRRLRGLARLEAASAKPVAPCHETRLDLATAVERLPLDQRLVISLHYGEGLGVEDIATAHGLPAGTVKSRLHAGRQTLKTLLQGAEDDQCR
jgi:RNA polymerase sigma-70 factor, ECF subfamily